jgi:hypothetical protein
MPLSSSEYSLLVSGIYWQVKKMPLGRMNEYRR